MRRFYAAVLVLLFASSCAPVAYGSDPYSQKAQAEGYITATQVAQSIQATNAAILQAAQQNEAAAEIAKMQQAIQSTQAALAVQQTAQALDIQAGQATATAQFVATATQQAQRDGVATATQRAVVQATEAQIARIEEVKGNVSWAVGVFLLVVVSIAGLFVLRVSSPIFIAMAESLAAQIQSRYLMRTAKDGRVYAYVPAFGGADIGYYLPAEQVIDYARLTAQVPRPVYDSMPADDRDGTPAEYYTVQKLLSASLSYRDANHLDLNQLASQNVAHMGGGQWDSAVAVLENSGVQIQRQNGKGTYIVDERFEDVEELWEAMRTGKLKIVPIPTAQSVPAYGRKAYERSER